MLAYNRHREACGRSRLLAQPQKRAAADMVPQRP